MAFLIVATIKVLNLAVVDDYKWENVKPYLVYIVAFVGGIYCNMRVLSVTNVETVVSSFTFEYVIIGHRDTICVSI